jgi:hypothetical protein
MSVMTLRSVRQSVLRLGYGEHEQVAWKVGMWDRAADQVAKQYLFAILFLLGFGAELLPLTDQKPAVVESADDVAL